MKSQKSFTRARTHDVAYPPDYRAADRENSDVRVAKHLFFNADSECHSSTNDRFPRGAWIRFVAIFSPFFSGTLSMSSAHDFCVLGLLAPFVVDAVRSNLHL